MQLIYQLIERMNAFVWGPPMLVVILGTGLFLTLALKAMPVLNIRRGFREMWHGWLSTCFALFGGLTWKHGTDKQHGSQSGRSF